MIHLKLVCITLLWAATFYLGQFAVTHVTPLPVAGWRFVMSAVVLWLYVHWHGGWPWRALRQNAPAILVMGLVGIVGFNVALFYGLQHTSPINAGLIMAFYPALTAVMSALINRERASQRQLIGFVVSLSGVLLVISQGSWQVLKHLHFAPGDLLVLLASSCWAMYSVIPKRFVRDLPPLTLTSATIVVGAVGLAVLTESLGHAFLPLPEWRVMLAILIMGLLGTVLAYVWWNQAVEQLGATRVASYMNLVPVFTCLIGLALGQSITLAQVGGAVLVMSGVMYTASGPRTG